MGLTVNEIAQLAAITANNKKANKTLIIDIRGLSVIADYFIICNGNSETQVQAITKEIKDKMSENGIDIKGVEGLDQARWVLIDLGDVVVHVFHREDREFYNLERLWGDAPRIDMKEEIKRNEL